MARWAVVLFFAVGCANAEREEHPTHLDFGLSPDSGDLSAALTDLATARDQAMPDQREGDEGTSSNDFSVEEDLEPPPDLRPAVTCDLSGGVPSRLWMAGVASGGATFAARFHPSTGWQVVSVANAPVVAEVAAGLVAGQPILIDRGSPGNSVDSASYDGCSGSFTAPAQIFAAATTLNRPSLVGGSSGDIVFRGSVSADQRLYHSHSSDGTTWLAPTTQGNMLTTLAPAAVRYRGAIHALFAGTNLAIYDGTVDDVTVNGGSTSQIGSLPTNQTSLPPAAIVDGNGRLVVVWTQTDSNLNWFARGSDGTTVTGPSLLTCTSSCTITSPLQPALALDASGNVVVAWSGGNKLVYSSTLSGSTWSLPQQASGTCSTTPRDCESTLPPALSTGLAGDDLEMVFVRDSDGKAVHVRMQSGVWQTPSVFTSTNFLTQPALVTSPLR